MNINEQYKNLMVIKKQHICNIKLQYERINQLYKNQSYYKSTEYGITISKIIVTPPIIEHMSLPGDVNYTTGITLMATINNPYTRFGETGLLLGQLNINVLDSMVETKIQAWLDQLLIESGYHRTLELSKADPYSPQPPKAVGYLLEDIVRLKQELKDI